MTRLNLNIPIKIHEKLKKHCIDTKITMTNYVLNLISEALFNDTSKNQLRESIKDILEKEFKLNVPTSEV